MLSVIPTEPPASVWRKLWPYVRPYKQALGMGVLLLLATNALDKTIPWLLQLAIDALNAGQFSQVQQAALAITGCALAMAAVRTLSRMRIFYVGRKVEHDLRGSVLDQLHRLGSSFFMRMPTGDIMSRAINDVTQVRLLVGFGLLNLVNAIFAYVLTLGLMLAIAPGLTVIALAPYPVLALGARAFGRAIHRRSLEQQRSLGHLSERVQDNLAGMRVVRAFGIEAAEIARFETANQRALRANMALVLLRALMWPVLMGLSALATLLVIWLGARRVLAGELSVGELVRFYAYVAQLFWPTLGLGYILAVIQRGTASFGRIREILDAAPSVPEAPHPKTPKGPGEVRVESLWFRFGDANTHAAQDAGPTRGDGVAPAAEGAATAAAEGAATAAAEGAALKGVTLRAEPRRMLAVVGRTGSGKSTLAALLPRLSPTPPGTVFLDGEDITTLRLRDLRRTVGYAPQDAFLFSASVADNIGFGLDDGTEDRDTRIRSAARAAGVLHEIEALPQGFATQVGERGVQLSGGQRQRVALARALAIDPQVLVLDDPLSAVDARTEAAILDALERAGRARTLVLVTHRIAAARRADHIVVLDRGRVVEQGDHPSLMRRRGIYARLAEQQRLRAALEQTA